MLLCRILEWVTGHLASTRIGVSKRSFFGQFGRGQLILEVQLKQVWTFGEHPSHSEKYAIYRCRRLDILAFVAGLAVRSDVLAGCIANELELSQ
jgi:hypothetical protein